MAEVLGLVASSMSMARITGSILTNGLKLKALLDEVKDAPENLGYMLDILELLTPVLCEAPAADNDDASSMVSTPPSAPSHLPQVLQKALAACQRAAEQLELLVRDLKLQIDVARGGARRKRAMIKVVLKKGVLAQHEMRLQKTLQLLTLAQNNYIIALQRTQPETIASQVIMALNRSPQSTIGHCNKPEPRKQPNLQVSTAMPDWRASSNRPHSPLRKYSQWGIATVTGFVRIQSSWKHERHQSQDSAYGKFLRIQVRMPTWLSAVVLDATLSSSYAGWTCSLSVHGNIVQYSDEYELATAAILADNVDAMCRLFQERRCGPFDHLVSMEGCRWRSRGLTMLECALANDAWQVAEYLLSHGVQHPVAYRLLYARMTATNIQSKRHLERVLEQDTLSDQVRLSCLTSCPDDVNLFTSLVGRMWPGNAFYNAAFADNRLCLAMIIVHDCGRAEHLASPAIFRHLCESLALEDFGAGITAKCSLYLANGLGQIVWLDPALRGSWHCAIWDTATRFNNAFLMPEKQLGEQSVTSGYNSSILATPFTNLFANSMRSLPGRKGHPNRARQHKVTYRLANCEAALQLWLQIISGCGLDLLEYGRQTKRVLRELGSDYNFEIYRDVWFDKQDVTTLNGLFEVRLIGFNYGSQPGDWKLWWSEPTDGLVGDFWRKMDPEPLRIPGSWVED